MTRSDKDYYHWRECPVCGYRVKGICKHCGSIPSDKISIVGEGYNIKPEHSEFWSSKGNYYNDKYRKISKKKLMRKLKKWK